MITYHTTKKYNFGYNKSETYYDKELDYMEISHILDYECDDDVFIYQAIQIYSRGTWNIILKCEINKLNIYDFIDFSFVKTYNLYIMGNNPN